jgi:hypothetical protein
MSETPNLGDPSPASARGGINYAKGYSFEDRVAEAYRLLGYSVEHGRIFSGRQVDLFLDGVFGDVRLVRAIECKVGDVTTDDIDRFLLKLALVKREYPIASGTVVGGRAFTDAVTSHAAAVGVQLTYYKDLHAQLIEGTGYMRNFLNESSTNRRYRPNAFIEPLIGFESVGDSLPAFEMVDRWLLDGNWNQFTLLGDVGTGKSFLARMITRRLATAFLAEPTRSPLPLFIDLRNADREFSLEGLVNTFFANHGLKRATFAIFDYLLAEGNIVLVLDGFDEMASKVTPTITTRNFHQLARCVKGRAKVFLTCRTHYFRSRTETEEVVLGSQSHDSSEVAKDLFWDLIARAGFKIAYLRPFSQSQIERYVNAACGDQAGAALSTISRTYNLSELSQRPLLLEMIVQSLDKLAASKVKTVELYDIFTDVWIHRDRWREILAPEQKLAFLTALARTLWEQEQSSIHYKILEGYVETQFKALLDHPQHLIELDGEIRTATFLTRDDQGNYGFAHSSYAEYFLARYLAAQLESGNLDALGTRRLTNEVVDFFLGMTDGAWLEGALAEILQSDYRPLISENAVVCLYRFRRTLVVKEQALGASSERFEIEMPTSMQLQGARLAGINLEGAILQECRLDGADLQHSILNGTDLSNSSLRRAMLHRAELQGSTLTDVDASEATLTETNFFRANVERADFSGANLVKAHFVVYNLRSARYANALMQDTVLPTDIDPVEFISEATGLSGVTALVAGSEHSKLLEAAYEYVAKFTEKLGVDPGLGVSESDVAAEVVIMLMSRPTILSDLARRAQADKRATLRSLAHRVIERYQSAPLGIGDMERRRQTRQVEPDPGAIESAVDFWRIAGGEADERDKGSRTWEPQESEELTLELLSIDNFNLWYASGSSTAVSEEFGWVIESLRSTLSERAFRMLIARYVDGRSIRDIAEKEELSSLATIRELEKAREVARESLAQRVSFLRDRSK